METNQQNQQDNHLWRTARKRAGFKWSLLTYIIVNIFFVILWFLGDRSYFWPLWCILGWGVGLTFQYFNAYHRNGKGLFSVDKEYEKLKDQHK